MQKKIVGLDGCNAYMRVEYDTYHVRIDLISYSTRVARVELSGLSSTRWYLAPASTCSKSTIQQVKRFFSKLDGKKIDGHVCEINDYAYNALKLGFVARYVNASVGRYDRACTYSGETVHSEISNDKIECAGADCFSLQGRFEPRKPFVNGCFEVKPSTPGAWRVW